MGPNTILLGGALAPAGVALLAVLAGALVPSLRRHPLTAGVSTALALWAGAWFVIGVPDVPPVEATDVVPFAALLGLAWASGRGVLDRVGWAGVVLRAMVALAVLRWTLDAVVQYTWDGAEAWLWLGALSSLAALVWTGADRLGDEVAPVAVNGVLALVLGGTGLILASTGSLKLGQLAGALGAGLGVLAVAGLRWREAFPWSASSPAVLSLVVLLAAGVFYSETPRTVALLLGLAPLGIGLTRSDVGAIPWRAVAVGVVPAAVAFALVQLWAPEPFVPGQY